MGILKIQRNIYILKKTIIYDYNHNYLLYNNNNNISDSVDDRDQKPRYGIEVLLNLSRYQPALGNERINTK